MKVIVALVFMLLSALSVVVATTGPTTAEVGSKQQGHVIQEHSATEMLALLKEQGSARKDIRQLEPNMTQAFGITCNTSCKTSSSTETSHRTTCTAGQKNCICDCSKTPVCQCS